MASASYSLHDHGVLLLSFRIALYASCPARVKADVTGDAAYAGLTRHGEIYRTVDLEYRAVTTSGLPYYGEEAFVEGSGPIRSSKHKQ